MKAKIHIQQEDRPSKNDIAHLSQQYRAYNDQQCGSFPSKELNLFAYAPDKEIIGGLRCDISWGWLHVDVLWVAALHRQDGIGTSLMDRAEAEAKAMGVHQAYLEATDFQALGFYEKRGYQVFAQLEDQPPGHICYYIKNSLIEGK